MSCRRTRDIHRSSKMSTHEDRCRLQSSVASDWTLGFERWVNAGYRSVSCESLMVFSSMVLVGITISKLLAAPITATMEVWISYVCPRRQTNVHEPGKLPPHLFCCSPVSFSTWVSDTLDRGTVCGPGFRTSPSSYPSRYDLSVQSSCDGHITTAADLPI